MDLKSGLPINRRNVTDIPAKNLVIIAMDKLEEDNKIATLNIENKSVALINPNYQLEGMNYEDKNKNESEDIHNYEQNSQKHDIKQYERVYE